MSKLFGVNRREFLVLAVPLYAAGPLETYSRDEARPVEALCDQVIPADAATGAKKAGVLYYIDRQLAGPLRRFKLPTGTAFRSSASPARAEPAGISPGMWKRAAWQTSIHFSGW